MKEVILALGLIMFAGCTTVSIQSTKCWEGHYYTQDEAKTAVESIQLGKGESVWILSDKTLNRVLKNTER